MRFELTFSSNEASEPLPLEKESPAMTSRMTKSHNPTPSPKDSRYLPHPNADPGSALHYIDSHYQEHSHSLADTQFTDDPQKFDWDLPAYHKIHQDIAIISGPHFPRSQAHYYLPRLGDPNHASSPSSSVHYAQYHPEHDPYSSAAATARPDWRTAAIASGRAGSYYDYSLHPDHLRDRLFFQGFVIPPDAALQGATTAAIQDLEALRKETGLLRASLDEKQVAVSEFREEVDKKAQIARGLRREVRGLRKARGMLDEDRDESVAIEADVGHQSDVSDTFWASGS